MTSLEVASTSARTRRLHDRLTAAVGRVGVDLGSRPGESTAG